MRLGASPTAPIESTFDAFHKPIVVRSVDFNTAATILRFPLYNHVEIQRYGLNSGNKYKVKSWLRSASYISAETIENALVRQFGDSRYFNNLLEVLQPTYPLGKQLQQLQDVVLEFDVPAPRGFSPAKVNIASPLELERHSGPFSVWILPWVPIDEDD